jgi:phosphate uptake regulator
MAGAECPWPEQDNRYQPRRDSDLLNVLDHRIHGLDEVIKDLHYNDGFKMMFRSAMPILKKLRDFYQNQYDTVSVRVEEERNKKKAS